MASNLLGKRKVYKEASSMLLELFLSAAIDDALAYRPKIEIIIPETQIESKNTDIEVNMVVKYPLYREIFLQCSTKRKGSNLAIMSYSEISGQFCTPKYGCYGDILTAANESCR